MSFHAKTNPRAQTPPNYLWFLKPTNLGASPCRPGPLTRRRLPWHDSIGVSRTTIPPLPKREGRSEGEALNRTDGSPKSPCFFKNRGWLVGRLHPTKIWFFKPTNRFSFVRPWNRPGIVVSRRNILPLLGERAGVRADVPVPPGPISAVRWQQSKNPCKCESITNRPVFWAFSYGQPALKLRPRI